MLITANTKIGAVIKSNPEAIDVLIAANKHFIKLKNPLLRKILAPRVTIAEAAKIGKCSIAVILESLSKIGFEIEKPDSATDNEVIVMTGTNTIPAYDYQLDVRQELANGADPFNLIMKKVAEMDKGQTLLLINSFEPVPLIRILKGQGHIVAVSCIEADLVYTYITKCDNGTKTENKTHPDISNETSFKELLIRYKDNLIEIDVRGLEMPQPMIAILNSIDQLLPGKALYVHHKKVPVYLLPELNEKGFQYAIEHQGTEVKMIIFPETTHSRWK